MIDWASRHCEPVPRGTEPLSPETARLRLETLEGWDLDAAGKEIRKTFSFPNYHETLAFVNATAWVSHREDHHPDLEVGYNRCTVRYSTHDVGGLSDNDFICAAKIDRIERGI